MPVVGVPEVTGEQASYEISETAHGYLVLISSLLIDLIL